MSVSQLINAFNVKAGVCFVPCGYKRLDEQIKFMNLQGAASNVVGAYVALNALFNMIDEMSVYCDMWDADDVNEAKQNANHLIQSI